MKDNQQSMTQEPEQAIENAALYFERLQESISASLEECEKTAPVSETDLDKNPATFQESIWQGHSQGGMIDSGGGRTRVLENGRVFERAGVNFSDVSGKFPEDLAATMPGKDLSREFRATGISLVIHPRNPYTPTVHANFRCIRRGSAKQHDKLWFGGGADLTPYYFFHEDVVHFHRVYKEVCDRCIVDYNELKRTCDEYFYLKHRNETRGVGGIFFDYLEEPVDEIVHFVEQAGAAFLSSYEPIVKKRNGMAYETRERDFQLWRRGRYVEFNLIYDRGTVFGLKTGGRIESILMSMPPLVSWQYDYRPAAGSPEEEMIDILKNPKDWV